MRRWRLDVPCFLIPLTMTVAIAVGCQSPPTGLRYHVEPVPEYTELLHQTTGWTGADGIFSIPINGDERPGAFRDTDTFFIFSDTFIGELLEDKSRKGGFAFVNNTCGWRDAGDPYIKPIDLRYAVDPASNRPTSLFHVQETETMGREWFWMKDGIALDGEIHIFASKFTAEGPHDFNRLGLTMISFDADAPMPYAEHEQRKVPFCKVETGDDGAMVFGACVFPNTTRAHAPDPDGYIYIYGTREIPGTRNKRVVVGRVPEDSFTNFSAWRFYDGASWVTDFVQAATIAEHASNELSVSPLGDGQYILVSQVDSNGPQVAIRIAPSPVGPWGEQIVIYECPEATTPPEGRYAYNAKAHPHLSRPGELLISYNVNTHINTDHYKYGDLYRPRFIRMVFEP